MLAPQIMSEKIRMNEMVASSKACVPFPVSPKVWEMIMAMRKLSAAANIFVPKVFRIFLNTMFRIGIAKIGIYNLIASFSFCNCLFIYPRMP